MKDLSTNKLENYLLDVFTNLDTMKTDHLSVTEIMSGLRLADKIHLTKIQVSLFHTVINPIKFPPNQLSEPRKLQSQHLPRFQTH